MDPKYPPHPAEVKMPEYEALMTALAKFAKTSSCPAYLKTAYLRAQAQ